MNTTTAARARTGTDYNWDTPPSGARRAAGPRSAGQATRNPTARSEPDRAAIALAIRAASSRAIALATTQRLQLGGCQGCHPGIVRRSRQTTSQSIPSVTAQATHNPRPIHHSRCDPSIAPTTKAIGPMVPAIPATSQKAQWAHGGCRSHGRCMETVFPTGWASSTEWLTVVISWPGGYAVARSGRRFGRQGAPRAIRSRSHLATRGRQTGRPHRRPSSRPDRRASATCGGLRAWSDAPRTKPRAQAFLVAATDGVSEAAVSRSEWHDRDAGLGCRIGHADIGREEFGGEDLRQRDVLRVVGGEVVA